MLLLMLCLFVCLALIAYTDILSVLDRLLVRCVGCERFQDYTLRLQPISLRSKMVTISRKLRPIIMAAIMMNILGSTVT